MKQYSIVVFLSKYVMKNLVYYLNINTMPKMRTNRTLGFSLVQTMFFNETQSCKEIIKVRGVIALYEENQRKKIFIFKILRRAQECSPLLSLHKD